MAIFSSGTFAGVNEKQLDALKNTIKLYYNKCNAIVTAMNANNKTYLKQAFKGTELQNAIQKYIASVETEASEWLSQIMRYMAAIDDQLATLKQSQTKVASVATQATQQISNQTTRYTYGGGGSAS